MFFFRPYNNSINCTKCYSHPFGLTAFYYGEQLNRQTRKKNQAFQSSSLLLVTPYFVSNQSLHSDLRSLLVNHSNPLIGKLKCYSRNPSWRLTRQWIGDLINQSLLLIWISRIKKCHFWVLFLSVNSCKSKNSIRSYAYCKNKIQIVYF
jgi:hypothetical protein